MPMSLKVLEELVNTPSVSGCEGPLRALVQSFIEEKVDEMEVDALGNVIARKKGKGKIKILLEAHMDQIGFLVKYIEKNGMIRVEPAGGINPLISVGERVLIYSNEGAIEGVIAGAKAPHLQKDKQGVPEISELYVDIGADKDEDAKKYVSLGDVVVYKPYFKELINSKIAATALDNKISVYILMGLIEALKDEEVYPDVYFLFAAQEEVGLRGARTGAFSVEPDVAIVLDVTHALYPPLKETEAPAKLGEGPVIMIAPSVHPKVLRFIIDAAKDEEIKVQYETAGRFTGTDTDVIQMTKAGIPVGLISIPLKYMHSVTEVASFKDIEATERLLLSIIKRMDEKTSFMY